MATPTATGARQGCGRAASFVVGDPKQSIYRFRRADIAMYDAVKRDLFGGELQEITQNFRSVEPVIEWVNSTFSALFVESRDAAALHQPAAVAATGAGGAGGGDAAARQVPGSGAPTTSAAQRRKRWRR
jgi:ATP-dependent exoDNAse (exonuclease V) beta subunit